MTKTKHDRVFDICFCIMRLCMCVMSLEARWWVAVICPILMVIRHNLPLQSDTLTQTLHPTATQHRSEILRACTQNGPAGKEKKTQITSVSPISHTRFTPHCPGSIFCKTATRKVCVRACLCVLFTEWYVWAWKKSRI